MLLYPECIAENAKEFVAPTDSGDAIAFTETVVENHMLPEMPGVTRVFTSTPGVFPQYIVGCAADGLLLATYKRETADAAWRAMFLPGSPRRLPAMMFVFQDEQARVAFATYIETVQSGRSLNPAMAAALSRLAQPVGKSYVRQ